MLKLCRFLLAALIAFAAVSMAPLNRAHAARQFSDGICETTATTGTGTLSLAGACTGGYLTFLGGAITSGNSVPYTIINGSGSSRRFETGWGIFTDGSPDTLTRVADWSTDGAGAELSLSGTSQVFVGPISSLLTGGSGYGINADTLDGVDSTTLLKKSNPGDLVWGLWPELPSNCLWPDGSTVSRTTYATLMDAITVQLTGTTTSSSTSVTSTSKDVSVLGLVGARIEGSGIPSSTTVSSATSSTITLSQNATASASGVALRIFPFSNGDQSTTFTLPNLKGKVAAVRDNVGGTSGDNLTAITGSLNGDVLGATGGGESVTFLQANLPAATNLTVSGASSGLTGSVGTSITNGSSVARGGSNTSIQEGGGTTHTNMWESISSATLSLASGTVTFGGTLSISLGGSGTAFSKVQPTAILNACIYTG